MRKPSHARAADSLSAWAERHLKRFGKKEAPSEDGALSNWAEAKSKSKANDEGGGYAIRRVGIGRGRRVRRQPGCRRSGPREEDSAGSHRQPEYARRTP